MWDPRDQLESLLSTFMTFNYFLKFQFNVSYLTMLPMIMYDSIYQDISREQMNWNREIQWKQNIAIVSHSAVFTSWPIMFKVVDIIVNTKIHYIINNKRDRKLEGWLNAFGVLHTTSIHFLWATIYLTIIYQPTLKDNVLVTWPTF